MAYYVSLALTVSSFLKVLDTEVLSRIEWKGEVNPLPSSGIPRQDYTHGGHSLFEAADLFPIIVLCSVLLKRIFLITSLLKLVQVFFLRHFPLFYSAIMFIKKLITTYMSHKMSELLIYCYYHSVSQNSSTQHTFGKHVPPTLQYNLLFRPFSHDNLNV